MKKIIIIIPAFNEEENINQCLDGLIIFLQKKLNEFKHEIIVIDDGSTDKTVEKVLEYKSDNIILLQHYKNKGLGASVQSGIYAAELKKCDYLIKFDADCQHEPDDIKKIIQPLINGKAELVYGNRIYSKYYKRSIIRVVGNWFFTRIMRYLTGWKIKDGQPGLFAISGEFLKDIKIFGNYNYTQQVLLSAKNINLNFYNVNINFYSRKKGHSFVDWKYFFKVLSQIFFLCVYFRPLSVFGKIGIFFIILGSFIFTYESFGFFFGSSNKVVRSVNLVLGLLSIGINLLVLGLLAQLMVKINSHKEDALVIKKKLINQIHKKNE